MSLAGVAHPVERHLAKVEVASSSLVTRSIKEADAFASASFFIEWASPVSTAMRPYEDPTACKPRRVRIHRRKSLPLTGINAIL